MYQPPSSSSSSVGPNNNLTRYASAPGSFLSAAVDSVIGPHHHLYFSPASATSDSTQPQKRLDRSYGGDLIRQNSSPAGFFLTQLGNSGSNTASDASADNGFSGLRSSNSKGGITRLNSQLSFTRQDSILSHISEEESENGVDEHDPNNGHIRKGANSYGNPGYGSCSWSDDPSNGIAFSSSPSSKRAKNINGDAIHSLNREESQLQFGLHQSALEMAAMDNLMHIPEDSVPCKIRAKRGCATHPRSIAERERRTRISGKLKKLQDLVPNMDKQTSYADMLDLAVQHIKGLQNQVHENKIEQAFIFQENKIEQAFANFPPFDVCSILPNMSKPPHCMITSVLKNPP